MENFTVGVIIMLILLGFFFCDHTEYNKSKTLKLPSLKKTLPTPPGLLKLPTL